MRFVVTSTILLALLSGCSSEADSTAVSAVRSARLTPPKLNAGKKARAHWGGGITLFSDSSSYGLYSNFNQAGPSSTTFTYVPAPGAVSAGLQLTRAGNCVVQANGSDLGQPLSAGQVVVEGALLPISQTPQADGTYPFLSGNGPAFLGGEEIEFKVAGKGPIPHMEVEFKSPPVASISTTFPDTLSRQQDLVIDWTVASGRPITHDAVMMVYVYAAGDPTSAMCAFPITKHHSLNGHGVIPAAALALLPPGDTFLDAQSVRFLERATEPGGNLDNSELMDFSLSNETDGGSAEFTLQ
jgi:hypothetical protein